MRLKVEQLAKIEEATIDVKNLTIFVGKNSTNKSYMAHTVYMVNKVLSKFYSTLDNSYKPQFNDYLESDNGIKALGLLEDIKRIVTEKEIQTAENKSIIKYETTIDFSNIDLVTITKEITTYINEHLIKLINESFNVNHLVIKRLILLDYKFDISRFNKLKITSQDKDIDTKTVLEGIFFQCIQFFSEYKTSHYKSYFPASRTGFVLAFEEIVSGVLRSQFGGKFSSTKMTEPMIDFISKFSEIKSGILDEEVHFNRLEKDEKALSNLLDFIEERLIRGKIIEDKTTHRNKQFYLRTLNDKKLDLHLSSSATVELLPLIIFLKYYISLEDRLLVIEEPEAHLHPKAQIEMARLLVMLSNAGAKVLITTHSDYILNEISNCIKLSNASDEKKQAYLDRYELDEDTVISASDVSAYLFRDIEGDKIEVDELTIDEYGIANDNFDDILDELLERTDEINEMVL